MNFPTILSPKMWPHSSQSLAFIAFSLTCANAGLHTQFAHQALIENQDARLSALTPEENILVKAISNTNISKWSSYYTHGAHLAGKNFTMAQWTADCWRDNGWNSSIVSYQVYLNYPVDKSLSVTYPNGSIYQPSLEEAVLDQDDTTGYPNRIPTFHGYSASGAANAEFVYVGQGQQSDFARLIELGVPLEGKIAISKYGGPVRGLKVKNAQDNAMLGVIIFTDTIDDGNITEANGHAAYPDGPARNPSAVQRGSVLFLSTYPGDPTTPGYPSKNGSVRIDPSAVIPRIPSIPISYADAIPILAALDGYGTPGSEVGRTGWVGALNVSYSTGPAPGTTISMTNLMETTYAPIWNSIGIINGTIADETIVIGNHRDAWIIGGGWRSHGSAIMVELSSAFGSLLSTGWRPKRNIVLASWDGEEFGLLGSVEFVEEYAPWLTQTTVSYVNVDVGTSGPWPYIEATPELHTLAMDVMQKVIWMDTNRTMKDVWLEHTNGSFGVLGSGSDYTAFVHRGIGSIDITAERGPTDPVYQYHSNFDSYHWMSTYGDPDFLTHKSMAQYLSLLVYNLADQDAIQFDLPNYTTQLEKYYEDLLSTIDSTSQTLDTSSLRNAIDEFGISATEVQALEEHAVETNDPELLTIVNHKYRDFQRGLVSQGGLPNREFYRHLIFAPGIDTGYAATTYPGITEALQAGNIPLAAEFVRKTADAILTAASIIKV